TTDDDASGEHVVIIFVPLAGGPAGRCAFEDEVVLFHPGSHVCARCRSALTTTTTLTPSLVRFPSQRADAVRVHFSCDIRSHAHCGGVAWSLGRSRLTHVD